jgi:hypothetical protein
MIGLCQQIQAGLVLGLRAWASLVVAGEVVAGEVVAGGALALMSQ